MKTRSRSTVAVAMIAIVALLGGCWGYNGSSKRWAYVGDSLLIAGGGAAIAADVATKPEPCTGPACTYEPTVSGLLFAGVLVATAGLVGILLDATRAEQKTTR